MIASLVGRVAKLTQAVLTHKNEGGEITNRKERSNLQRTTLKKKANIPNSATNERESISVLRQPMMKTTSLKGSKTQHGVMQHPLQLWKDMIGISSFLSSEGNHKHSLLKKSPDIGKCMGNALKKPAKVKSALKPHGKEWAGDGAQVDISAAIYPCLAIGLTAFWGMISDPVILTTSAPSLLDPQALQLLDPELLRQALNPGLEKVVFDPLSLSSSLNPEASAEVEKSTWKDFESNLRQKKYGPAAVIFLGAALTMMILLKGSGTAN